MTSARDDIFSNIRRSLGVTGREAPRVSAVNQRISLAPVGVIPARGQLDPQARVKMFCEQAQGVQATTTEVAAAAVPAEIARYLRDNNLPATLRMGADARLTAMNWSATTLAVTHGASEGDDLNAVSHAFGGVAETGTLVLTASADNPTTLNFLPDNHIVVIAAEDIAGDYETVLARLRETYGKGQMPRTTNFVSGPSRTADIAGTLVTGAHGPRRLCVIVVGG